MLPCLVAALLSLCGAAPDSFTVMVRSPISVQRSHTVTLPCWLDPAQSAESLEVYWYRENNFDSPIVSYRDKNIVYASHNGLDPDRVSFGTTDASSGGLKSGEVSLRLFNVTLEDAGDYTCYVSSDRDHDNAVVRLAVKETGSPPLLSAVWRDDQTVNMSCSSEGWYPEPRLRWSDLKEGLTPNIVEVNEDPSGLLSVHSWVLVPSSSEVSCSVGLSGEEEKESKVRLDHRPQPAQQESAGSAAGWLAFALLLVAVLIVFGVLCYKKRVKKNKKDVEAEVEESQKLLPESIHPTDLLTAKKFYENVTLQGMENKYLRIKDGIMVRARDNMFPTGTKVSCLTAVIGTPGFTSGQHYWEVSLESPNVPAKKSWWVGVTGLFTIPADSKLSPSSSKGFWFLSSSAETPDTLELSTEPKVSLPITESPTIVGVYLNYESGEISFYNVEKNSLIGTLTAKFKGKVFPLFNPGLFDQAPLTIIQKSIEQDQSTDVGKPVSPGVDN